MGLSVDSILVPPPWCLPFCEAGQSPWAGRRAHSRAVAAGGALAARGSAAHLRHLLKSGLLHRCLQMSLSGLNPRMAARLQLTDQLQSSGAAAPSAGACGVPQLRPVGPFCRFAGLPVVAATADLTPRLPFHLLGASRMTGNSCCLCPTSDSCGQMG